MPGSSVTVSIRALSRVRVHTLDATLPKTSGKSIRRRPGAGFVHLVLATSREPDDEHRPRPLSVVAYFDAV